MDVNTVADWHAALLGTEAIAINVQSGETLSATEEVAPNSSRILFPGAFNPLHAAHRAMADVAATRLDGTIEFEMSIENVDKRAPRAAEIQQRLRQFSPHDRVWITRASRFTQKAALFPGATFIVGADTIARIADAAYYRNDAQLRAAAMAEIVQHGCRFLVFGRRIDGRFMSLAAIDLPSELAALCSEVPREDFDVDLSSTQLRIAAQNDSRS